MYRPLFVECPAIAAEVRGATGLWCLARIGAAVDLRAWYRSWNDGLVI